MVVPGEFSSLPSRVVNTFKDGILQIDMVSSTAIFMLIGALMLVMVVVVGFYERSKYKNKFLLDKKEGGAADGEDVYSMEVIPEDDSRSVLYHSTVHTTGASADTASLPTSAVTYQDQVRDLGFSSHPRPNIVTSVGDNDGVA